MNAADAPGGTITLRPGRPPPNITSTRPALSRRIGAGCPAAELPQRIAAVYALCGGAHRVAARAALAAASGAEPDDAGAVAQALCHDTLREHLRRIVLDWPAPLAGDAPSPAELRALRALPAHTGAAGCVDATPCGWIERHLLGEPAAAWLVAWDADPSSALARWAALGATPTARRLHACRAAARSIAQPVQPLPPLEPTAATARRRGQADAADLTALLADCAAALRADAGFALAPRWRGQVFESGCWARLDEPAPRRHADAWLRLGARVAEAARLALPRAARSLRFGALAPAAGEGVGWCEMARGLLVHRVRVDGGAHAPRVAECDVLAPTEWHFHPEGPVAAALARLPARGSDAAARLLAAAFDPCVAIRVEAGDA